MIMTTGDIRETGPDQFDVQRAIRVDDYLNDKLQTTADLANIDTLLEDVRKQQRLLEQQVCSLVMKLRYAYGALASRGPTISG